MSGLSKPRYFAIATRSSSLAVSGKMMLKGSPVILASMNMIMEAKNRVTIP
jgi:hypothetical protein